jgi:hydroxypyruvate isomerase
MELALSMWSVHRTVRKKGWTVLDFLAFCEEEGIRRSCDYFRSII